MTLMLNVDWRSVCVNTQSLWAAADGRGGIKQVLRHVCGRSLIVVVLKVSSRVVGWWQRCFELRCISKCVLGRLRPVLGLEEAAARSLIPEMEKTELFFGRLKSK